MAHDPRDFFRQSTLRDEAPSHAERVAPQRADARREAPPEETVGSTDYKAYGVMPGGCADCDVRKWKELRLDLPEGVMFDYRLLTMIQYSALDLDGIEWEIDLMFPDCIIRLIGRHLEDLRFQLRRRKVSFIQEYSPMIYKTPLGKLPEGEPVISKIHIMQYGDRLRRDADNQRPV
ncbi:hypothetical protein DLJ53_33405 [Acuticoccus sediminis]|uniref:Uncharacterized protein n=1 Tax=Acuticoccus sediminis TaxID=2184697 RepID=A0A8B2NEW4_9HYPH|nr:hypothetical protein [Acuticoccus sediminis]RAH96047.1 hypothetical protein DLJ53_33405 [Acuticoccus sediminis]